MKGVIEELKHRIDETLSEESEWSDLDKKLYEKFSETEDGVDEALCGAFT